MSVSYRRLLLHPGLLAPIRRALLARSTGATARSRLEVWENEGGALGAYIRGTAFSSSSSSFL